MLVTINTDASFHPQLKFGAYAFWAVCNEFKITKSGVFRSKCKDSHDAETRCIVNALNVVLLSHKGITKVIVNTDSLNAIAILTNDKAHIKRYMGASHSMIQKLRNAYKETLAKNTNKITIEFRWVKAHSGVNNKRSFVNEWCDSEAKRQLRSKILKTKNQ